MLGIEVRIVRGYSLKVQDCLNLSPRYIVIGPGPGSPSQASFSKELMRACAGRIPLLGVCLGHQALAELYGGTVVKAKVPMHGKTSSIFHDQKGLFSQIPQGFKATRYHSLIVEEDTLPPCLEITARTDTQEVMGIRHRFVAQAGIQFHPESILTEHGLILLSNFLDSSTISELS